MCVFAYVTNFVTCLLLLFLNFLVNNWVSVVLADNKRLEYITVIELVTTHRQYISMLIITEL